MSAVPDPAAEWERYVAAQEYLYETVWRGIAGACPEDGGALIEVAWIGDEFTLDRRSAECVECGAASAARGPDDGHWHSQSQRCSRPQAGCEQPNAGSLLRASRAATRLRLRLLGGVS